MLFSRYALLVPLVLSATALAAPPRTTAKEAAGPPPHSRGKPAQVLRVKSLEGFFRELMQGPSGAGGTRLAPAVADGKLRGLSVVTIGRDSRLRKLGVREGDTLVAVWLGRELPKPGSGCSALWVFERKPNLVIQTNYSRPKGRCCGKGWLDATSAAAGFSPFLEGKCP